MSDRAIDRIRISITNVSADRLEAAASLRALFENDIPDRPPESEIL
jgi:hypothetical protein